MIQYQSPRYTWICGFLSFFSGTVGEGTHFSLHGPQVIPVLLLIVSITFQLSTEENFRDIGNNTNQHKQALVRASPTTFLVWRSRCEQQAGAVANWGNYTLRGLTPLPGDVTGQEPGPCHCSALGSLPIHRTLHRHRWSDHHPLKLFSFLPRFGRATER